MGQANMNNDTFDYKSSDSQGTIVEPVEPNKFDLESYADYEAELLEGNKRFWHSREGVQVYRRFRVPEVFSYGCADLRRSLSLQLGGLEQSMKYKADVPNFLEPWYGIGVVASAFGLEYVWKEGQAPATEPRFSSVQEALDYGPVPVEKTVIGSRVLEMIDYFLEMTKGRIPISLTDTQSPYNVASYLIETNSFYTSVFDCPDDLKRLLERIASLSIDFTRKQYELIGSALASPGHGFASSREFDGVGMSSDNMMMLSPEQYRDIDVPSIELFGNGGEGEFGGPVFHSCGNWTDKIEAVKMIENLRMVDGAFSKETDPDANPPEPFSEQFAGTGVVLNARIVGNVEKVTATVKRLWGEGMKLIVVTYCSSPEEQMSVYNRIHSECEE